LIRRSITITQLHTLTALHGEGLRIFELEWYAMQSCNAHFYFLSCADNNNVESICGRERERERGGQRKLATEEARKAIAERHGALRYNNIFRGYGGCSRRFLRAGRKFVRMDILSAVNHYTRSADAARACNGLRSRSFGFSNPMIVIRTMNMFIRNLPRDLHHYRRHISVQTIKSIVSII